MPATTIPTLTSSVPPILLSIDGMMCQNNCGTTVLNALQSVRGVQAVQVSFLSAVATITTLNPPPPTTTSNTTGAGAAAGGGAGAAHQTQLITELIEAVEEVGFGACLLQDSPPTHILAIHGMMCQRNCGTTVQNALLAVSIVCELLICELLTDACSCYHFQHSQ